MNIVVAVGFTIEADVGKIWIGWKASIVLIKHTKNHTE